MISKIFETKLSIIFMFFLISNMRAQSFSVEIEHTTLFDTLGSEMVFETKVSNNSTEDLSLAFVREINDLPAEWASCLCFTSCYAPFIDSIVTNSDYDSGPLSPGDTIDFSVHVNALTTHGTGTIKLKIFNIYNNSDSVVIDLIATTIITSVDENKNLQKKFYLSQNYPNPFNPSTKIDYQITQAGEVSLKVYNLLGKYVANLVDEFKEPGKYATNFTASGLGSGIYIYKLQINGFSLIRKMLLIK